MEKVINAVNGAVWSPALIILLIGAGLYFTIRTRCVQVRRIGLMARLLFNKDTHPGHEGFSSFQAFCVALSGRVGTGNIVGVATAIALGGPGAFFWMWVIAFLGASTAFVESTLAQMYKFKHHTGYRGGPACYIDVALGKRWLSVLFVFFTLLGYGTFLAMVQANGISVAINNSFEVPGIVTGLVLMLMVFLVVAGGMKRIAKVASAVTPFMALGYVLMAFVILAVNWKSVPGMFGMIFTSAFGTNQVFGGLIGSAIAMGVKRGLFSNEAGQGGGAIVSGSADVSHPAKQGLVQAFSVYIDTLLVCTATALMILCTGNYNVFDQNTGEMIVSNAPQLGSNYVAFTQASIDSVFNGFGGIFVSVALAFFVFTTLIAYYFYSESSIIFLCRIWDIADTRKEKVILWIYRIFLFTAIVLGSCTATGTVWTIGDIGLGLTTWINVIVLLILSPRALKALADFENTLNDHGKRH